MNKVLIIFILLIFSNSYSQNLITENKKAQNLIQIWGLLKYKHPNISKGNFDFDKEFINEFSKIKFIKTQEKLNTEFINWIYSFDSEKEKIKIKTNKSTTKFTKNEDYPWIENSNFGPELTKLLIKIKNNNNYGKHYAFINKMSSMVNFNNDTEFVDFDSEIKNHRLLFLASFWNKMRYWNVNIYLTEISWNKVLTKIIPEFVNNKVDFKLAKDKLFAYLSDSHSNYNYSNIYNNPKRKYSLYGGRIVNDTLVIKTVFNDEFAKKENIAIGDMIYSINGKKLKDYYTQKFGNRISTSNNNYLKGIIERSYLLSDTTNFLTIGLLKKDGEIKQQKITLYKYTKKTYKPKFIADTLASLKWGKLNSKIGFINLKEINKSELKNAFKTFKNNKGIIIDLRNYPRNLKATDLPYFLYPKKKVFMKILTSSAPAIGKYDNQSALKIIKNPFAAGRNNKNFYKGKVILLVNRITGSMAEYFAMAIQGSPNCITIGEQTFGAVMNRNEVILKDKTKIDYTSIGAFYPDNTNVQRQGLKIDYYIQEKAKDFDNYQYINEAIKIIIKN